MSIYLALPLVALLSNLGLAFMTLRGQWQANGQRPFAAFLLAISDRRLGDTILAPIVLVVTGIGIFALLKSLGYLNVPKRDRSGFGSSHDRNPVRPIEQQRGDASDVEVSVPWDDDPDTGRPLSMAKPSSE